MRPVFSARGEQEAYEGKWIRQKGTELSDSRNAYLPEPDENYGFIHAGGRADEYGADSECRRDHHPPGPPTCDDGRC